MIVLTRVYNVIAIVLLLQQHIRKMGNCEHGATVNTHVRLDDRLTPTHKTHLGFEFKSKHGLDGDGRRTDWASVCM